jgi:hypothetical protein
MGSSVKASGMPEALRNSFIAVFSTLPYNVVWKWEGGNVGDLPPNVRTAAWWPQQELLGHPRIRAFVSHGGLLSLHEAAYHGSPTLVLPVFCDHDGNAAQAGKNFSILFHSTPVILSHRFYKESFTLIFTFTHQFHSFYLILHPHLTFNMQH